MDEAWAAARGNAGDVSHGGARQYSPEFGDFEAPGSVRGGVWPGRELVARLIHRSGLRKAAEAAAAGSAAEAGLRGGARRRTGVPATGTAYGLPKLARRGRGKF